MLLTAACPKPAPRTLADMAAQCSLQYGRETHYIEELGREVEGISEAAARCIAQQLERAPQKAITEVELRAYETNGEIWWNIWWDESFRSDLPTVLHIRFEDGLETRATTIRG